MPLLHSASIASMRKGLADASCALLRHKDTHGSSFCLFMPREAVLGVLLVGSCDFSFLGFYMNFSEETTS